MNVFKKVPAYYISTKMDGTSVTMYLRNGHFGICRAKGKYSSGMNKEGIVIRPMEPVYSRIIEGPLSMKVLNNEYLLKE